MAQPQHPGMPGRVGAARCAPASVRAPSRPGNADLCSRAVLPATASGWYAFLTLFARVTFWGTNFIALWVFPHVAARSASARRPAGAGRRGRRRCPRHRRHLDFSTPN